MVEVESCDNGQVTVNLQIGSSITEQTARTSSVLVCIKIIISFQSLLSVTVHNEWPNNTFLLPFLYWPLAHAMERYFIEIFGNLATNEYLC